MSTVKANSHQVGQSATATNNFTWYQPSSPDGTVRLAVGNAGATTLDTVTVNSSGNVGIGTSSPGNKLHVQGSGDAARFTNGSANLYVATDASGFSLLSGAGQTGTGLYANNTSSYVSFYSASSEKMRLDSSGNLGLGVTPSAWSGAISSAIEGKTGGSIAFGYNTTAALYISSNWFFNGTSGIYKQNGFATQYGLNNGDGSHRWYTAPSGTAGNAISFTQAMTLDASGNLLVGDTSATSIRLTLKANGNNYGNGAIKIIGATSGSTYITSVSSTFYISNDGNTDQFIFGSTGNFTISGATATKASGTTWANPSDIRLKDNIQDYKKGLAELNRVRVRTWDYNGKGGTTAGMRGLGVIADEAMIILPDTVDEYSAKINANDENETLVKRFDATEITWLLVKSVQELSAELNELKAKVNA